MLNEEDLNKLSKDQLIELLFIDAKNLIAMDGVWFQSIEKEMGMEVTNDTCSCAWEFWL